LIELHDLTKRYDEALAVDALNLTVARGELLMLVGGSGCGKTTTLKMVNRLVEPSAGRVNIDGVNTASLAPHELRRRIGYAFQQVGLFPHLHVAANIAITPRLLGWPEERVRERVASLLRRVELEPEEFAERLPGQLSGGQQQRVGLARAIAAEPEVLLLDEPFGALDPLTRDTLQTWFQRVRLELGLTTLFVTHDMVEALLLADRIAVLDAGKLVQIGTPHELLAAPANASVAALIATPRRQAEEVARLLAAPGAA
jgi:osmoprotectant transport system ATP-binding protein